MSGAPVPVSTFQLGNISRYYFFSTIGFTLQSPSSLVPSYTHLCGSLLQWPSSFDSVSSSTPSRNYVSLILHILSFNDGAMLNQLQMVALQLFEARNRSANWLSHHRVQLLAVQDFSWENHLLEIAHSAFIMFLYAIRITLRHDRYSELSFSSRWFSSLSLWFSVFSV